MGDRNVSIRRRAWNKVKKLSRKGSLPCTGNHDHSGHDEQVPKEDTQSLETEHSMPNGRQSLRHSISKLSTASSNRTYFTAHDSILDSSSSRINSKALAELDEYGAELDARRISDSKRGDSLKSRPTDLPAVPETEARLQQNGSAQSSHVADQEGYPDGERGEFLKAYDAALLKMLNELHGSEASCIADLPLLEVAPWNQRPGYLGNLSGEQKDKLAQMRKWFPHSRQWHTDHDILRFLRAREFELQKTKELYTKYVEKLFKLFPQRDVHVTAQMQKLKDYFLHTVVFHLDKEGRPVVYFKPAHIVKNNMNKYVDLKYRIAFQSSANEGILHLMKMASKQVGYHVENSTQVLDLAGISALQMLSHMRSEESQSEWEHNMDFQPEVLHKIYIINAPAGMSAVWKFASLFVPAATRNKVEVFGSNYFSALESLIGKEHMPSCYGGNVPFEWHEHRSPKELKH